MSVAIKVENLSKAYQLGEIGTGTLSQDLQRYWSRVRGKEDPFLKIGETNDRASKGKSDIVLSLRDINFEIQQGEAVGVIGRNGAGKSTLLKILSRVTAPTTGSVKMKGRISSLLEVGTGFHPELTGRENIYLNGAILGMRKSEIKRKFDEIVNFSGVARYIDTPVKRYSSGMYVRLAFAVAAHLESEILIVDEVLAVGDAEFQKKCLGKMGDVSKGEGRTVLFVSHNMAAIANLCNKALLLEKGFNVAHSTTDDIIDLYLNQYKGEENILPVNERTDRNGNGIVRLTAFECHIKKSLIFELSYLSTLASFPDAKIYIAVYNIYETCVLFLDSSVIKDFPSQLPKEGNITITISEDFMLVAGTYSVNIALLVNNEWVDHIESALKLNIEETDFYGSGRVLYHRPTVHVSQNWTLE